ncbi:MAG: hypothetical protein COX96_07470, partial [Candidatus Omnitrophica bacterium CG_4_10_14_0_2_um_filter_44_9]
VKGWTFDGAVSDIKADIYTYQPKDATRPAIKEVQGLQNKVIIPLSNNRFLAVMDDHNYAYPFWWLMRHEGVVPPLGNRLLHIDAHADAALPWIAKAGDAVFEEADFSAAEKFSQQLGIEGFIAPLKAKGFFGEWFWQYDLKNGAARMAELSSGKFVADKTQMSKSSNIKFNVLDIDLDVLSGMGDFRAPYYLAQFAKLARQAQVITIATSPNFYLDKNGIPNQGKAIEHAKYLAKAISSSPIKGPKLDNTPANMNNDVLAIDGIVRGVLEIAPEIRVRLESFVLRGVNIINDHAGFLRGGAIKKSSDDYFEESLDLTLWLRSIEDTVVRATLTGGGKASATDLINKTIVPMTLAVQSLARLDRNELGSAPELRAIALDAINNGKRIVEGLEGINSGDTKLGRLSSGEPFLRFDRQTSSSPVIFETFRARGPATISTYAVELGLPRREPGAARFNDRGLAKMTIGHLSLRYEAGSLSASSPAVGKNFQNNRSVEFVKRGSIQPLSSSPLTLKSVLENKTFRRTALNVGLPLAAGLTILAVLPATATVIAYGTIAAVSAIATKIFDHKAKDSYQRPLLPRLVLGISMAFLAYHLPIISAQFPQALSFLKDKYFRTEIASMAVLPFAWSAVKESIKSLKAGYVVRFDARRMSEIQLKSRIETYINKIQDSGIKTAIQAQFEGALNNVKAQVRQKALANLYTYLAERNIYYRNLNQPKNAPTISDKVNEWKYTYNRDSRRMPALTSSPISSSPIQKIVVETVDPYNYGRLIVKTRRFANLYETMAADQNDDVKQEQYERTAAMFNIAHEALTKEQESIQKVWIVRAMPSDIKGISILQHYAPSISKGVVVVTPDIQKFGFGKQLFTNSLDYLNSIGTRYYLASIDVKNESSLRMVVSAAREMNAGLVYLKTTRSEIPVDTFLVDLKPAEALSGVRYLSISFSKAVKELKELRVISSASSPLSFNASQSFQQTAQFSTSSPILNKLLDKIPGLSQGNNKWWYFGSMAITGLVLTKFFNTIGRRGFLEPSGYVSLLSRMVAFSMGQILTESIISGLQLTSFVGDGVHFALLGFGGVTVASFLGIPIEYAFVKGLGNWLLLNSRNPVRGVRLLLKASLLAPALAKRDLKPSIQRLTDALGSFDSFKNKHSELSQQSLNAEQGTIHYLRGALLASMSSSLNYTIKNLRFWASTPELLAIRDLNLSATEVNAVRRNKIVTSFNIEYVIMFNGDKRFLEEESYLINKARLDMKEAIRLLPQLSEQDVKKTFEGLGLEWKSIGRTENRNGPNPNRSSSPVATSKLVSSPIFSRNTLMAIVKPVATFGVMAGIGRLAIPYYHGLVAKGIITVGGWTGVGAGLAGLAVFGAATYLAWKHWLSAYKDQPKLASLATIVNRLVTEEEGARRQKITRGVVSRINGLIVKDQSEKLSPAAWIGTLIRKSQRADRFLNSLSNNKAWVATVKVTGKALEIPSMFILYTFLLKHVLVPSATASYGYSSRIPEETIAGFVNDARAEIAKQESQGLVKKSLRGIKDTLTLKFALDYSDDQIIKFTAKMAESEGFSKKALYAIPAGLFVVTRSFYSLIAQRLVIGAASMYVAPVVSHLLFSNTFLSKQLFDLSFYLRGNLVPFNVTPGSIIHSFIVVTVLDIPFLWNTWKKGLKDGKPLRSLAVSVQKLAEHTISMMLVGPEIQTALNLTNGVPVVGPAVQFMEEFVYGANGTEGIGTLILKGIEDHAGINPAENIYNPLAGLLGRPDWNTTLKESYDIETKNVMLRWETKGRSEALKNIVNSDRFLKELYNDKGLRELAKTKENFEKAFVGMLAQHDPETFLYATMGGMYSSFGYGAGAIFDFSDKMASPQVLKNIYDNLQKEGLKAFDVEAKLGGRKVAKDEGTLKGEIKESLVRAIAARGAIDQISRQQENSAKAPEQQPAPAVTAPQAARQEPARVGVKQPSSVEKMPLALKTQEMPQAHNQLGASVEELLRDAQMESIALDRKIAERAMARRNQQIADVNKELDARRKNHENGIKTNLVKLSEVGAELDRVNGNILDAQDGPAAVKKLPLLVEHAKDVNEGNNAYTYGNALAVISLLNNGQFDEAQAILRFFSDEYNRQVQTGKFQGFPEAYDALTGDIRRNAIRAGNQVWLGLAAITFVERTRSLPEFAKARQANLELAQGIGQWLVEYQKLNGTQFIAQGDYVIRDQDHKIKYDVDGRFVTEPIPGYSLEHNIDAYAFLNILGKADGVSEIQRAGFGQGADAILHTLPRVVTKEWYLARGMDKDGNLDGVFATDVQALAIQAIGPETLSSIGINPADLLRGVEKRAKVEVDYVFPDTRRVTVEGFDYIDHDLRRAIGGKALVTPEWTSEVAGAYQVLGQYEKAQRYLKEISKMIWQDTLPYATAPNAPVGHGWNTPGNIHSLTSTAYYDIARIGDNPFTAELENMTSGLEGIGEVKFDRFEPVDNGLLGTWYAEEDALQAIRNFFGLKIKVLETIKRQKDVNKEELLAFYVGLNELSSSLFSVGQGDLKVGVSIGGEMGSLAELINVGWGIVNEISAGEILNVSPLAWLAFVDAALNVVQQPRMNEINGRGGIIVPDRNWFTDGLNLGVIRISPTKVTLLGDRFKVVAIETGDLNIFPDYLSSENRFESDFKVKGFVNVTNLLEDLMPAIVKAIKGEKRDYPAVVVFSDRQKEFMRAAILNNDPDLEHFVERRGQMQILSVYNRATKETTIVSYVPIYFENTPESIKANGMETQTFLTDTNAWMQDGIYRVPGVIDLSRSKVYIESVREYGLEVDPRTGELAPYKSIHDIPAVIWKRIPKVAGNMYYYDASKKVEMTAEPVPVDPRTGNVVVPGMKMALAQHYMNMGLTGEQSVTEINNGILRKVLLESADMPKAEDIIVLGAGAQVKNNGEKTALTQDTRVTFDKRYTQNSLFKYENRPFVYIQEFNLRVPVAIVHTFRNTAPYTVPIYSAQELAGLQMQRLAGVLMINFGSEKLSIQRKEGSPAPMVTFDERFVGYDENGQPIPAIIDFAFDEKMGDEHLFGVEIDKVTGEKKYYYDEVPVGGIAANGAVKEAKVQTGAVDAAVSVVEPWTMTEKAVADYWNHVKKFAKTAARMKAHELKYKKELYTRQPLVVEAARQDMEAKLSFERIIKQAELSKVQMADYQNLLLQPGYLGGGEHFTADQVTLRNGLYFAVMKDGSRMQVYPAPRQLVINAQESINNEVVKVNSDLTKLDAQLTLVRQKEADLRSKAAYWFNQRNAPLVDYYLTLAQSSVNEAGSILGQQNTARNYLAAIQRGDETTYLGRDLSFAEKGVANVEQRRDMVLSLAPIKRGDSLESMISNTRGFGNVRIALAEGRLTDSKIGVQYAEGKEILARQGVGILESKITDAAVNLTNLNDERALLNTVPQPPVAINPFFHVHAVLTNGLVIDYDFPRPSNESQGYTKWSLAWLALQLSEAISLNTDTDISDDQAHFLQEGIDYWGVRLADSIIRENDVEAILIPQAGEYVAGLNGDLAKARAFQDNMKDAVQVAIDFDEAEKNKVDLEKIQKNIDFETQAIIGTAENTARFKSAPSDMADFQEGVVGRELDEQKRRAALYEEKAKIMEEAHALQAMDTTAVTLTEEEIKAIMSAEDPEGEIQSLVTSGNLGVNAVVTNIFNSEGNTKVDVATTGAQLTEGTSARQTTLWARTNSERFSNNLGVGYAKRYHFLDRGPFAEADEFTGYRFVLTENPAVMLYNGRSHKITASYMGYFDKALSDREAGDISAHTAILRDTFSNNLFWETGVTSVNSSGSQRSSLTGTDKLGEEIEIPADFSLNENYQRYNAAFGYRNVETGSELSLFIRRNHDTSDWTYGAENLYGFRTGYKFGDTAEFELEGATGTSNIGRGSLRFNLTDDLYLQSSAEYSEKYDTTRASLAFGGLSIFDQPVELSWNPAWFANMSETNSFSIRAPVYSNKDKDTYVKVYDDRGGFIGLKTQEHPLQGVIKDMPKEFKGKPAVVGAPEARESNPNLTLSGNQFIPGPLAYRGSAENLSKLGQIYYFSGKIPAPVTRENYPQIISAESLVVETMAEGVKHYELTKQARDARIGLSSDNRLYVNIAGFDTPRYLTERDALTNAPDFRTLLVLPGSSVNPTEYPAVVELGVQSLERMQGNLRGYGVVFGAIHKPITRTQFEGVINAGALRALPVIEDGKLAGVRYEITANEYNVPTGNFEPGLMSIEYLSNRAKTDYTLPLKTGMKMLSGEELARAYRTYGLQWTAVEQSVDGNKVIDYVLTIPLVKADPAYKGLAIGQNNDRVAVAVPAQMVEQSKAFLEGSLKKDGDAVVGLYGDIDTNTGTMTVMVTRQELARMATKAGQDGKRLEASERDSNGGAVLRVSGTKGIDGKPAVLLLNEQGLKILDGIRRNNWLVVGNGHAYYESPGSVISSRQSLMRPGIYISTIGPAGETVGRVYLNKDLKDIEVEHIVSKKVSVIYPLVMNGELYEAGKTPKAIVKNAGEKVVPGSSREFFRIERYDYVPGESAKLARVFGVDGQGREVVTYFNDVATVDFNETAFGKPAKRIYNVISDHNLGTQKGWALTIDTNISLPHIQEKANIIRSVDMDGKRMKPGLLAVASINGNEVARYFDTPSTVQIIFYTQGMDTILGTETYARNSDEYQPWGPAIERSVVISENNGITRSAVIGLTGNNSEFAKYDLATLRDRILKMSESERSELLKKDTNFSIVAYDTLGRVLNRHFGIWIEINDYTGRGTSETPQTTKLYHDDETAANLVWEVSYKDNVPLPVFAQLPQAIQKEILALGIDPGALKEATVGTNEAWGATWTNYYDDLGRNIASVTVEGTTISVDFNSRDGKTPVKSYLVTPSVIYLNRTKADQAMVEQVVPGDLLADVSKIPGIMPRTPLFVIGRVAAYIKNLEWNATGFDVDAAKDVVGPSEELFFMLPGNPLGWDLARIAPTGYKSINKWWLTGKAPFGVLPGQVIRRNGDLMRDTIYDHKGNENGDESEDGDWFYYRGLTDRIEHTKTRWITFNYNTGVTFEEHEYVQEPPMRIYLKGVIPLYADSYEYGRWIRHSEYDVYLSVRGNNDLYYAVIERQQDHAGPIGRILLRIDRRIFTGEQWSIIRNGEILYEWHSRFNHSTTEKTEWSMRDQSTNAFFGIFNIKNWFISSPEARIKEGIVSEGHLYDKSRFVYQPAVPVTGREEWKVLSKTAGLWLGSPLVLTAVILFVNALVIRVFLKKKEANVNEMTVKDFEDFGFAHKDSTAIVDRRRANVGFKNDEDFFKVIEEDLARTISDLRGVRRSLYQHKRDKALKLIGKKLKQEKAVSRSVQYRDKDDVEGVLEAFGLEATKEVAQSLVAKGDIDLIGIKVILTEIEPFYGLMAHDVFQAKFLARLMKAAHFQTSGPDKGLIKDAKRTALRDQVAKMFKNLGLDIGFRYAGETAWLFDSILKSIVHAPDFEELDMPKEVSPSGTYVVTSDDMEKYPVRMVVREKRREQLILEGNDKELEKMQKEDEDRRYISRWRIVSLEHFELMQVISAQVVALNGNGRFEEWIYEKIKSDERTNKWHENERHGTTALKSIDNIYVQLLGLFWKQMGGVPQFGKQEQVKDKYGHYRFHQWSLLWEEWNEAFRFLLGQSELNLDGKLYIKGEEIRAKLNALRVKFDEEVTRLYNGGAINEQALLNLIKALIFSVERATLLPRVKHRLKHYQLFWMPFFEAARMLFNKEIRSKYFSVRKVFGEHVEDVRKKFYVGLVFALNTGLFSALACYAIPKWSLLSVPYSMTFSYFILAVPVIYIAVLAGFSYLRANAVKKRDLNGAMKWQKRQLFIQAGVLAAGFMATMLVPGLSHTFAVWESLRWLVKVAAYGIFFATYLLSFYSVHYGLKFVITLIHYW